MVIVMDSGLTTKVDGGGEIKGDEVSDRPPEGVIVRGRYHRLGSVH